MVQCDRFQQQRGAASGFAALGDQKRSACRLRHAPQVIASPFKPPMNPRGLSFEEGQVAVLISSVDEAFWAKYQAMSSGQSFDILQCAMQWDTAPGH